jgi:hypothetical protein
MPDEPNKKMDEMLRNYADQRRKAPELTLHPATRQMLRGEVARVHGSRDGRTTGWQRLRAFLPQISFAGGLCLIFGIAVLSLRQPSSTSESAPASESTPTSSGAVPQELKDLPEPEGLSKLGVDQQTISSEASPISETRQRIATKPEPKNSDLGNEPSHSPSRQIRQEPSADSSPSRLRSAPKPQRNIDDARRQNASQQSAVQIVPPREEYDATLEKNEVLSQAAPPMPQTPSPGTATEQGDRQQRLGRTLTATAPPAPQQVSRSATMTNLGAARRLSFSQVPIAGGAQVTVATRGANSILNNFQVEQLGTSVRILDEDGSIYTGNLQPTNVNVALQSDFTAAQPQAAALENSAAFYFRVQGTNQTLHCDVVVTGKYFAQTNVQPTSLNTFAIAPDATEKETPAPRHLIIGDAMLGGTNQVPVHAVSKQP